MASYLKNKVCYWYKNYTENVARYLKTWQTVGIKIILKMWQDT